MGRTRYERSRLAAGGHFYRKARARLLAPGPVCAWCLVEPADTADHVPALAEFPPGLWVGELVPSCRSCNSQRGARLTNKRRAEPKRSRAW